MNVPNFDELAEFVRHFSGYNPGKIIIPNTLFENDLGITGDDGVELLETVEQHFDIQLTDADGSARNTFRLGPNEYLFNGEGFGFSLWWFGKSQKPIIHPFTVGELYEAICRQKITPSVSTQNSDPDKVV